MTDALCKIEVQIGDDHGESVWTILSRKPSFIITGNKIAKVVFTGNHAKKNLKMLHVFLYRLVSVALILQISYIML
jgi:hypothetical protein